MPRLSWFCGPILALAALAGCAEAGGPPAPENVPAGVAPDATPGVQQAAPPAEAKVAMPDFEPLSGARAHFGLLAGAAYRVEVPDEWNGGLLLWAKGFRGFGPEVAAESPPAALRAALIQQGYAWAASSYSAAGWIPGEAMDDTLALKRWFVDHVGSPDRTYIGGESMGGNAVVLSLEHHPGEYDGGLALCGVVAGAEWLDYLLTWGVVAEYLAGHRLPLDRGPEAAAAALDAHVLPALGPPENPTTRGRAFAVVIQDLTGGPRPFFDAGFRAAYQWNFGLATGDPAGILPMTRAATTEGMVFRAHPELGLDDGAIDRGIRHLAADLTLRDPARYPGLAPTTGNLQDPLLTLHETGDVTVPVSMEQSYRGKVDRLGKGDYLVQRLVRGGGHCQFSDHELVTAWNDLAAWVELDKTPAGDAVLGDLSDAGLTFTHPLREGDPALR